MKKFLLALNLLLLLSYSNIFAQNTPADYDYTIPTVMHGQRALDSDRLAHKPTIPCAELDEEWINITPSYFDFSKFDKANIRSMVSTKETPYLDGFSEIVEGNDNNVYKELWIYKNLVGDESEDGIVSGVERDLSKGVIFLAGGSVHEGKQYVDGIEYIPLTDQRESLAKGITTVDFGDEVGQVLVFNGIHSTLGDSLLRADYYKNNTVTEKARLIIYDNTNGNNKIEKNDYTMVFFPVDYEAYKKVISDDLSSSYTIRVRVELNCFDKSPSDKILIGDVNGTIDGYGDVIRNRTNRGADYNYQVMTELGKQIYRDREGGQIFWDATKWTEYETDLIVDYDNFSNGDGIPCIRVQIPANNLINLGAYMFRNVQMFIKKNGETLAKDNTDDPIRYQVNNYLLRPSWIVVEKQKIFVDEPTTLKACALPTWATRDYYWVLVDDDTQTQYSTLEEAPDYIKERIKSFNPETGEILASKNGIIRVQAISKAQGVNADGEEVEKVMSCITELPIFDVVHGIDILHEHLSADNCIELSGTESTPLHYQLLAKGRLENAKFDPETKLVFSTGSDDISINVEGELHGNKYSTDWLYDGRGTFEISANGDAALGDYNINIKVDDSRYDWDLNNYKQLFAGDNRYGKALVKHYAKPEKVRAKEVEAITRESRSASERNYTLYDDNTRLCISHQYNYYLTPVLTSAKDAGDELHAKPVFDWEFEDNEILSVKEEEDGRLILYPHKSGYTRIKFTKHYAGMHKTGQLNNAEEEVITVQTLALDIDIVDGDPNTGIDPVYIPFGPTWEKNFTHLDATEYGYKDPEEQDFIVEINNSGLSGVEFIENDNDSNPEQFYDIKGIKVESPSPGIYLRRTPTGVEKIRK